MGEAGGDCGGVEEFVRIFEWLMKEWTLILNSRSFANAEVGSANFKLGMIKRPGKRASYVK